MRVFAPGSVCQRHAELRSAKVGIGLRVNTIQIDTYRDSIWYKCNLGNSSRRVVLEGVWLEPVHHSSIIACACSHRRKRPRQRSQRESWLEAEACSHAIRPVQTYIHCHIDY